MPISRIILAVFCALLFGMESAFWETYTVRVQREDGTPVEAVRIYGNNGVRDLAGRSTDTNGEWSFDTADLDRSGDDPILVLSHPSALLRMEPAELRVNLITCPAGLCQVTAYDDPNATVAVFTELRNSDGTAAAGFPVVLAGALSPCPKFTDSDGYVVFAASRRPDGCSDTDATVLNDRIRVVPLEPPGKRCSFAPLPAQPVLLCPQDTSHAGNDGTVGSAMTASCTEAAPVAVGGSVSYTVLVRSRDTGDRLGGVTFAMNERGERLPTLATGSNGTFTVSTSLLGVGPDSRIMAVPTHPEFSFVPPELQLTPNSCPGNVCYVWAVPRKSGQGVVRLRVTEGGEPVTGVLAATSYSALCHEGVPTRYTDEFGEALIPVARGGSCSESNWTSFDDPLVITPSIGGCSFSHESGVPLRICPNGADTVVTFTTDCSTSFPAEFTIAGRVRGINGLAFPGVKIFDRGLHVATTDGDGAYMVTIPRLGQGRLSAFHEDFEFDPRLIQFQQVEQNYSGVDFDAVLAGPDIAPPPEKEPCPVESEYEISGVVFDQAGYRLGNVTISVNDEPVASTGPDGAYRFFAPNGSDNWITAELGEAYFDPAGIALVNLRCNEANVNFHATDEKGVVLGGTITTEDGAPFAGVTVVMVDLDEQRQHYLLTAADGTYKGAVQHGTLYRIRAARNPYVFAPVRHEGEAEDDQLDLNFTATEDLCPSDPDKLSPGQCGCGFPDTDTDGDGIADCVDGCPADENKSVPGVCGCGAPDTDTDADGIIDCHDGCPLDSTKQHPGVCGCGVADIDSDGDGVFDCLDECPSDPGKTAPGSCGCGIADADDDGDGILNCIDECPSDPNKTAPGTCGCGVLDQDSDGDGVFDCEDACPADSSKTSPGVCGCGLSETDADGDGVPDCIDRCAWDPNKATPGLCGCGKADIDTDGDGVLDCHDECPEDPGKIGPGLCGCGVPDDDLDRNGVPDCAELECANPLVLDFEYGQLAPGSVVTDQFAQLGVRIWADNNSGPDLAVLFDSANPAADQRNLGTPNELYGGPGRGAAGASNDHPEGRVLILEADGTDVNGDGLVDDPRFDPNGGKIWFEFAELSRVHEVTVIGVEGHQGTGLKGYIDGHVVWSESADGAGRNSRQDIQVDRNLLFKRFLIHFKKGGAVARMKLCPAVDECPSDPLKTRAGVCGCGVADEDGDGNGVIDCLEPPHSPEPPSNPSEPPANPPEPPSSPPVAPAPACGWVLHGVCSDTPATTLHWRVHNPSRFDLEYTWWVENTNHQGTVFVPAQGETYFETPRVAGTANRVRLYFADEQIAIGESTDSVCSAAEVSGRKQPLPEPNPEPSLLRVVSLCSGDAVSERRWLVINPGNADVDAVWEIWKSHLAGVVHVPANGSTVLTTPAVPNSENILRIFVGGYQHDAAGSCGMNCDVPGFNPVPNPTPAPECSDASDGEGTPGVALVSTDWYEALRATPSRDARVSGNGRYIGHQFFEADSGTYQMSILDRVTGKRINPGWMSYHLWRVEQPLEWSSRFGRYAISDNGRILFETESRNILKEGYNLARNLFLVDFHRLRAGDSDFWRAINIDEAGSPRPLASHHGVLSSDGRYTAFAAEEPDGTFSVRLYDFDTNRVKPILSGASSPVLPMGISGPTILLQTDSSLDPSDTNGRGDVFLLDVDGTLTRISRHPAGANFGEARNPVMSASGNYIAFEARTSAAGPFRPYVYSRSSGVVLDVSKWSIDGLRFAAEVRDITDGGQLLIESEDGNLVPADENGARDVFVVDVLTSRISRVSRDVAGAEIPSASGSSYIDQNGRFVAFRYLLDNLPRPAWHILMHDRANGLTQNVSFATADGLPPNGYTALQGIAPDGSVVFESDAENFSVVDTNGQRDIFLAALGADQCPCDPNKRLPGACGCGVPDIDQDRDGIPACHDPDDGDGPPVPPQPVKFPRVEAQCSEDPGQTLAWRIDNPLAVSVELYWTLRGDAQNGMVVVSPNASTQLFTRRKSGENTLDLYYEGSLVHSASASYSTCTEPAPTPTPTPEPPPVCPEYAVHFALPELLALNTSGEKGRRETTAGSFVRLGPRSLVALSSWSSNLDPRDDNEHQDVFVRNLTDGTTTLLSINEHGEASNGHSWFGQAKGQHMSTDGRFIVFQSTATNLSPFATDGNPNIFVADLEQGTLTLVSIGRDGVSGNGGSVLPSISRNGRFVAFLSSADNLVDGDRNGSMDVFVRDLLAGVTERVSVSSYGSEGSLDVTREAPVISADGRFVAFLSSALELADDKLHPGTDIFLHDRSQGTTDLVLRNAWGEPANSGIVGRLLMTPDGRHILVESTASNLLPDAATNARRSYLLDRDSQTLEVLTPPSAGSAWVPFSLSDDARFVSFTRTREAGGGKVSELWLLDRMANEARRLPAGVVGDGGESHSPLLAADGTGLIFSTSAPGLDHRDTDTWSDPYLVSFATQCHAPVETPAPTWTTTPSATPTVTPSAKPTATPSPTVTASPSPTPTATPEPEFTLVGALKDERGKVLRARMLRRLGRLKKPIVVHADNLTTGQSYQASLSTPFEWQLRVREGNYKIWLETVGRLQVRSRPRIFRLAVQSDVSALHFAVRFRPVQRDTGRGGIASKSSKSSAKKQKKKKKGKRGGKNRRVDTGSSESGEAS